MAGTVDVPVSSVRDDCKRPGVLLCECECSHACAYMQGSEGGLHDLFVRPLWLGLPQGVKLCRSACTRSISLACVQRSRSAVVDDEDDPAEAEKEGNEMEDEELDPLDAYMEEVKEEVKKFNMRSVKGGAGNEKVRGRLALVTCHLKVSGLFTLGDHKEGS